MKWAEWAEWAEWTLWAEWTEWAEWGFIIKSQFLPVSFDDLELGSLGSVLIENS